MEEGSKTWVRKPISFKSVEGVHRCIKFRSAKRCEALDLNEKGCASWHVVVLYEKNPHIRKNRDGTVIKLDVNNGVYTMELCVCFDEIGPVFSCQGQ